MQNKITYLRGAGYITSGYLRKFLFIQLAKFKIIIQPNVKSLSLFIAALHNRTFNFVIIENSLLLESLNKIEQAPLPAIRFVLLKENERLTYLVAKLGFLPIMFSNLNISTIAMQIRNMTYVRKMDMAFYSTNKELQLYLTRHKSYVIFNFSEYYGLLIYKNRTIKLSKLETVVLSQLAELYNADELSCGNLRGLSYKQITNTISRLRHKFMLHKIPLLIINSYKQGYCFKEKI